MLWPFSSLRWPGGGTTRPSGIVGTATHTCCSRTPGSGRSPPGAPASRGRAPSRQAAPSPPCRGARRPAPGVVSLCNCGSSLVRTVSYVSWHAEPCHARSAPRKAGSRNRVVARISSALTPGPGYSFRKCHLGLSLPLRSRLLLHLTSRHGLCNSSQYRRVVAVIDVENVRERSGTQRRLFPSSCILPANGSAGINSSAAIWSQRRSSFLSP